MGIEVRDSLARERVEKSDLLLGVTPRFSQLIQERRAVRSWEGEGLYD